MGPRGRARGDGVYHIRGDAIHGALVTSYVLSEVCSNAMPPDCCKFDTTRHGLPQEFCPSLYSLGCPRMHGFLVVCVAGEAGARIRRGLRKFRVH